MMRTWLELSNTHRATSRYMRWRSRYEQFGVVDGGRTTKKLREGIEVVVLMEKRVYIRIQSLRNGSSEDRFTCC